MLKLLDQLDWSKMNGLLPTVVQDIDTFKVLMLGYMTKEALKVTQETRLVTFYSRRKQRLWTKGETTNHFLKLVRIEPDCDNDALLVLAKPLGNVCYLGSETCFGDDITPSKDFLFTLESIIDDRYQHPEKASYTAQLFEEGIQRIAEKVAEEGVGVALAAVLEKKMTITNKCADLIYHLMILFKQTDISLSEVLTILEKKHQPSQKQVK